MNNINIVTADTACETAIQQQGCTSTPATVLCCIHMHKIFMLCSSLLKFLDSSKKILIMLAQ